MCGWSIVYSTTILWMAFRMFSIFFNDSENNLVYTYFHIIGDISSGKIPGSGIAGSICKHLCNCFRYCWISSPKGCVNLLSHQHYMRAPMSPLPCKRVLLFLLISTNLTGERWHLSVVLICISRFSWVKWAFIHMFKGYFYRFLVNWLDVFLNRGLKYSGFFPQMW